MAEVAKAVKEAILRNLKELMDIPVEKLIEQRIEKFSKMGSWVE